MSTTKHIAARDRGNRGDRGLASFIAVVMISIVAMGALALTALFQVDARRTQHHGTETQLRELLIAGAVAVDHTVRTDPLIAGERTVELPDTIDDAAVTARYTALNDGEKQVVVTAHLGESWANQTLTFSKTATGWALDRISLDRLR
jgi:hypothetical protein